MKNTVRYILIISVVLGLNATPVLAAAMPEPVPATQTDKQKAAEKAKAAKQKEKEKAAKQKEKEKAAKAKEKEKAAKAKAKEQAAKAREQEAKAKEQAAKQKEKEKAAQERQEAIEKKEAARLAEEQKAVEAYKRQQEELEHPKTPVISYFNLGIRAGYSAMMDKINGSYMGAGTINQSNALQQLKGGGGAGLNVTYNLEYKHFLFETGLDFRFLNSTSAYGFTAIRNDLTYPGTTYSYLFDNVREMRNMIEFGVPVMFGAQFNRFYFLLGAKVHYGLPMGYSQKGKYDIVVNDPALIEPYGLGIYEMNGQTRQEIVFKQPDISAAAEIGIDLDEWLQKDPDPKKKVKVKPGERQPFGRQHVHYRIGLFAEYGVLNTNATPAANPVEFATDAIEVKNGNTLLAMNGDTKLNNLFVGAKFTIQFEVPGKQEKQLAPPPSTVIFSVVDSETRQPLEKALIASYNNNTGKAVMREKQIGVKGTSQKHPLGSYNVEAKADGYYPMSQKYLIDEVGSKMEITLALTHRPILRVHVTNVETGNPVPATVQILEAGATTPAYSLNTDSTSGSAQQMLTEGPLYKLHIEQMGYETVDQSILYIGDSINIALTPIKKGEVFIVKNLHFATNKTRILSSSEEALNDLFMYLDRNPEVRIKIIGHTDNVGKDAANQKLSDGRANAVRDDLIERGISADRIEAEGRGETQPIDTNDTEEGRQNNRRVEIEIL